MAGEEGNKTVDNLVIEIEASSPKAEQQISALEQAIAKLQTVLSRFSSNNFGRELKDIGKSAERYSSAVERATRRSRNNREKLETISASAIDKVVPQRPDTNTPSKGSAADKIDQATKSSQKLSEKLKLSSVFAKGLSKTFDNLARTASTKLGGALNYIGKNTISSFIKPFTNAIGAFNKWKAAIGRIAFYRAIRSAIKMVTQGLSEGINNLYYYSQMVGTTFAPAMDSLATSSLYLKNSLGAMAGPLIEALAPAVNYLIDLFIELFNTIGMAVAAITGKSTFSKAVRQAAKYGDDLSDSMGSAAGSAEEFKRFLIGIDELNIIEEPDAGGSGGGAGSKNPDYSSMFEEVEIPSKFTDLAQQIKDAINKGDWYGAGKILADKLNGIIENWDAYSWGQNFGKAINTGIELAYGFLSNFDFAHFGSKLASLLNGALSEIDFNTLGKLLIKKLTAIPDMIIGFLVELDWGLVASSISNGLIGAFQGATEWLQSWDWVEIGSTLWQKIKDFFTSIDYAELARNFFEFLGTAIRAAGGLIGGFFGSIGADIKRWFDDEIKGENWSDTIGNILDYIGEGIGDIPGWVFNNIVDPFWGALLGEDTWSALKESGKNLIDNIEQGIKQTIATPLYWVFNNIVDPIGNALLGENTWSKIKDSGKKLITRIGDGVKEAIGSPFMWVKNHITDPFWRALINENTWSGIKQSGENLIKNIALGILKAIGVPAAWIFEHIINPIANALLGENVWSQAKESGINAFSELKDGVKEGASNPIAWLKSSLTDPLVNGIKSLFGIHSPSTVFEEIGKNLDAGLVNGIKNGGITSQVQTFFSDLVGKMKNSFSSLPQSVGGFFTNAFNNAKNAWASAPSNFKTTATNILNAFTSLPGNLQSKFTSAYTYAKNAWSGAQSNFKNTATNIQNAFSSLPSNIQSKFSSAYTNAKNAWSSAQVAFKGVAQNVQNAFSGVAGEVKNKFVTAYNNAKGAWSNAKSAFQGVSNQVVNGFSGLSSSVQNKFSSAFSSAKTAIQNMGWYSAGSNIVSGILNGMYNWGNSLYSWASSLLRNAKNALGIHSPSTLFEKEVGQYVGLGIVQGMMDTIPEVDTAANAMLDSVKDVFSDVPISLDVQEGSAPMFDPESLSVSPASYTPAEFDEEISETVEVNMRKANSDVVNVLYAVSQQIIRAINEKDNSITLNGKRVNSENNQLQKRRDRIYGT